MVDKARGGYLDFVRIFEVCRDIELYYAELYKYYAEIYIDNLEISNMWTRTSVEEEHHASQFVMAISMRKQGMVESTNIDQYSAEMQLKIVKSIYEGARASKPTLVDALRSAIKLEEALEKFHMDTIAMFTDESFKNMFAAMMKADNMHLARIEAAYKKELSRIGQ